MFHFIKGESAFGWFALELLVTDLKLIELKNLKVGMESRIYLGFIPSFYIYIYIYMYIYIYIYIYILIYNVTQ